MPTISSNEPIKQIKTEQPIQTTNGKSNQAQQHHQQQQQQQPPSVIVHIELSRLHYIPKPNKRRSEEMRKLGEKSDTRQEYDIVMSETKPFCDNLDTKRTSINESDSDANNKIRKCLNALEQSKSNLSNSNSISNVNKGPIITSKRKRENSTSSLSSLSTVSSTVSQNSKRRHEHKKDKSHKSKRRKEEKKEKSQRKSGEESFVNVPPTNHDREGGGGPRTPPSSTIVNSRNSSSNNLQITREYHSYFERTDDQLDEEGLVFFSFITKQNSHSNLSVTKIYITC